MITLLAASALSASGDERGPLWGEDLLLARVDLELRRAGGPRRDEVSQLLDQEYRHRGECLVRAAKACEAGVVPCARFGEAARDSLARGASAQGEGEAAARILLLASFEGMTCEELRQTLEVALRGFGDASAAYRSGAKDRPWARILDDGLDSACLALDKGFLDLLPLVDEVRLSKYGGVRARERVARALADAEPDARLVEILAEEVASDVQLLKSGLSRAVARDAAFLAIGHLRRRAASAYARELRHTLERYEWWHGGPTLSEEERQLIRDAARLWPQPPARDAAAHPLQVLGTLGCALAELVGDLGDRETEHDALGGPTLAERVEEGLRFQAQLEARDASENGEGCEAGLGLPAEVMAAIDALSEVRNAMVAYLVDNGGSPEARDQAELAEHLGPYLQDSGGALPHDPWGHPLSVWWRGIELEVRSPGRDGVKDQAGPGGEVDGLDADVVLGPNGFLQWPRGLPQQTVDLRQRFTYCMYRRVLPGFSGAEVAELVRAAPTKGETGEAGLTVELWENLDGSAIVVRWRDGKVVSAEWRKWQRPS